MIFDTAIIGAGPAGMSAAIELRTQGFSVVVLDEQPAPGGQIWRGVERNTAARETLAKGLGAEYRKGAIVVRDFRASGADYRPGSKVWQIEENAEDGDAHFTLFATRDGQARRYRSRSVLLAVGAQERPVPFEGWTLPGVMTVGAAQIQLKSGGMVPDAPVWIAGAGPLPLLYAHQLMVLGGEIAGILDTTPPGITGRAVPHLAQALKDWPSLFKGLSWQAQQRLSRLRRITGVTGLRAEGTDRLERLHWSTKHGEDSAEAGMLLVHKGLVPSIHPTLSLGCKHVWSQEQQAYRPESNRWGETSREGLFVAGDGAGIAGAMAALSTGRIAALGMARRLDRLSAEQATRARQTVSKDLAKARAARPLLDALYPAPAGPIADDVIVCRCEELTAGQIRAAARRGAADPDRVKAETRAGMGPCQGRQCGYTIARLIAECHDMPAADVGFHHIRPPLKPVTLGELATLAEAEE